MNRRNFLRNLIVAGAGFGILPGAARVWKKQGGLYRRSLNLTQTIVNQPLFQGNSEDEAIQIHQAANIIRAKYPWKETWAPTRYFNLAGNEVTAEDWWNNKS